MITFTEAKEIAGRHIAASWEVDDDEPFLLDDLLIEKRYGWVFFYVSRKYFETGDFRFEILGNGPILVEKETGEIIQFGTAHSTEHYLHEYEDNRLNPSTYRSET